MGFDTAECSLLWTRSVDHRVFIFHHTQDIHTYHRGTDGRRYDQQVVFRFLLHDEQK